MNENLTETRPIVSIITALYNCEKYLKETVESVKAQSIKNWEMIIVDDCSTDSSFELAQQLAMDDSRIFVLKNEKNSGPAVARNNGLLHAKGKYICFLDSDDQYSPNFLESQIDFSKANGPFVYSSYRRRAPKTITVFKANRKTTYKQILKYNPISCLTAFYDRDSLGLFLFDEDQSIRYREDYLYWMQILKVTKYAFGNPQVLASYRISSTGNSRNKRKLVKLEWRVFFKKEKLGFFHSIFYMICWAFNGWLRYRNVK